MIFVGCIRLPWYITDSCATICHIWRIEKHNANDEKSTCGIYATQIFVQWNGSSCFIRLFLPFNPYITCVWFSFIANSFSMPFSDRVAGTVVHAIHWYICTQNVYTLHIHTDANRVYRFRPKKNISIWQAECRSKYSFTSKRIRCEPFSHPVAIILRTSLIRCSLTTNKIEKRHFRNKRQIMPTKNDISTHQNRDRSGETAPNALSLEKKVPTAEKQKTFVVRRIERRVVAADEKKIRWRRQHFRTFPWNQWRLQMFECLLLPKHRSWKYHLEQLQLTMVISR